MAGRRRAAAVALITAGLLATWASPAFAPYTRQAAKAVNVTETCPNYLSLEVARQGRPGGHPAPEGHHPGVCAASVGPGSGTLVLNQAVRVRPVDPYLRPLAEEPERTSSYGRAVLRWDTGRLAPGTKLLIGPPEDFGSPRRPYRSRPRSAHGAIRPTCGSPRPARRPAGRTPGGCATRRRSRSTSTPRCSAPARPG